MPDRADLTRRLNLAAATLGCTPRALFRRHAWTVGHFPRSRPLPAVEDLTDVQLDRLVVLAEQSVRLFVRPTSGKEA